VIALLNWFAVHWFLLILLSVFGVFKGVRDFFVSIAEALGGKSEIRHQRKLEIERAKAGSGTLPAAPCRHRNIVGVRDTADHLVGWLCRGCDKQLPADFSVYEEDL
jgi:hypothetical protein